MWKKRAYKLADESRANMVRTDASSDGLAGRSRKVDPSRRTTSLS